MAQRILALDIGTSSIKLAEFSLGKDGGMQLVRYGGQSLGLDPHDEENRNAYVTATLKALISETGIKPGPVAIAVAGQAVFSRYIKLPPVDPDKVYQIVRYEAQQNVPFPMDDVVWDYQILPGGDDEQLDCLLVAIKREIISDVADAVVDAGMELDVVDVAPLTIFNAFKYNYEDDGGCSLVLDMGSRTTDLIFIEGDRIYNRSVPVAGNSITQQIARELDIDFADADELKAEYAFVSFGGAYEEPDDEVTKLVSKCVRSVMTRMHQEINRSINFYRGQQGGQAPTRILLTGGTSIIPYLDTFLSEKLGLEVEYLNPFQNVVVGEGVPEERIRSEVHNLSELVGLGLRKHISCPIEINLLPPAVATEKQIKKKQPVFLVAMVAGVLALVAWVLHFMMLGGVLEDQAADVQDEKTKLTMYQNQIQSASAEVESIKADLLELKALKESQDDWLKVLEDLRSVVPEGVWITSLEPVFPDAVEEDGRGEMLEPGAVPEEAPAGPVIQKIIVEGLGYLDYESIKKGTALPEVEKNLHTVDSFTDKSERTLAPVADGSIEYLQSFQFSLDLKEPIPYELEKIQNPDFRR